jgi:predicted RNA polymerase sigma factor
MTAGQGDSLVLLFLCCHPVLSRESQVALWRRWIGH